MAVPLGIVLVWLGYSVGYYGFNRITGGNDKFVSLIYPGRYKSTPRDGGGSSPPPAPETIQTKGSAAKTPGVPKTNPAPSPTANPKRRGIITVPGGKAKGGGGPTTTPAPGLG